jgi:hypothetical protein
MSPLNEKRLYSQLQYFLAQDQNFLDNLLMSEDVYVLNIAGFGLRRRYHDLHNVGDIKRSMEVLQLAVQKSACPSTEWYSCVNNLRLTYYIYYICTSDIEYLHQNILMSEKLVKYTALDSPSLPQYLHYLASYLLVRANVTKEVDDIKRAEGLWKEAINHIPYASKDKQIYVSRLFCCFFTYTLLTKGKIDLEEVAELMNLLRGDISIDTVKHTGIIVALSHYITKFYSLELADVDIIMHLWEQLIECTRPEAAYFPDLMRALSIILMVRFSHTKDVNDLQVAIEKQEYAFALSTPNTARYLHNLNKLSEILLIRYTLTEDLEDIYCVVELLEQGLAMSVVGSTTYPTHQKTLIEALQKRFERTEDMADLDRIQQLRSQQEPCL